MSVPISARIASAERLPMPGVVVASSMAGRFDPGLPAFSAIGYREAWAVIDGELTLDAAIEVDARRNMAFAKRQRTWFRAEPSIRWLDATGDPFAAALGASRAAVGL